MFLWRRLRDVLPLNITSCTPRWTQKTNGGGYSSPHLATLAGVPQILLMNGGGITSVGLNGSILWANHSEAGMGIVQPRVLKDGSVLAASGELLRGLGVRRLAVSRAPDGTWKVEERWTSRGLKPYFNDFVVHKGHAYGFDGTILSAINLETGERAWKGGRYGAGQMLLLPQQDLLSSSRRRATSYWWQHPPTSTPRSRSSRRSRGRRGTIPCSSETCCSCATAKRWRRSGCRSDARTVLFRRSRFQGTEMPNSGRRGRVASMLAGYRSHPNRK